MPTRTAYRICPLCEATCGIAVELDGQQIVTIRGDDRDPFSRGFICPKAYGLKALEEDPDRLRRPLIRKGSEFHEVSWNEAYEAATSGLVRLREQHGPNSNAVYFGNPVAHSLHALVYGPVLLRALGTQQRYSASSLDQLPKMVSAGLMFGGALTIPVPDVDRTDYLMVLGGNPAVSNGSLMTAPDMPGRLRALRQRGGRVVVIDPRRSETAKLADEHHFIRPGSDALFLLGMAQVMFNEKLVRLRRAEGHVTGLEELHAVAERFAPERVARATGIDSDTIRRLARELCAAERAVCYGRIGTTCQRFGTLASWGVDVINVLSGHLDAPGGAGFVSAAARPGGNRVPQAGPGRGVRFGRWHSRVGKLQEMYGELPVCGLADEILEAGDERVRGLVTVAGNPVLSAPSAKRMDEALGSLEHMVSVDFYLNETTRHASVILPPPSPLRRDTYDLALYQLAIRHIAKYSQPSLPKPADHPNEWEILATLAKGVMGMADADLQSVDDFVIGQLVNKEVGENGGRWKGLTTDEALAALGHTPGPARALDLFLRTGPYGDGFGRNPSGISLDKLRENPHGVDLGPLMPVLPEVLTTQSGKIELLPELIEQDLPRLEAELETEPAELLLIGRRHLRSNNSWMHNLTPLVKGPQRCTLLVNPDDAARLGLIDGGRARVQSRAGSVVAPVRVTDEMMPGVVSLPHGWGHDLSGVRASVATEHAGVNVNILSDARAVDTPSNNAAFNGLPVEVEPA